MNMKWYVLHVLTGSELEAQRQLRAKGIEAVVFQETAVIRRGGIWHHENRILFPGYIFVYMHYTANMHYLLKEVSVSIRLLPKEGPPQSIPDKEAVWLLDLCGEALTPSKVDFNGPEPVVIEGPLKELEQYVVKYNRRQKRVSLRIPVLDEHKDITLSILPV